MKVTYEFDLDNQELADRYQMKKLQNTDAFYDALYELDNLRRNLCKGYKYYKDNKNNEASDDEVYSLINTDLLIDDIIEILQDSNYHLISEG